MNTILNTSSTTKRQILTPVRRETFSEPTEHWYKEHDKRGNLMVFKQYRTRSCKSCPAHSQCTISKNGRILSRTKFAEYYEANRKAYQEKEHLYKRRQAIVEHPYGTIKRQWGFSYILTKKGISRASSDVGLMFIAYNLRRIGNILTKDRLKEYLRILLSLFLTIFDLIREPLRQSQSHLCQSSLNLALMHFFSKTRNKLLDKLPLGVIIS